MARNDPVSPHSIEAESAVLGGVLAAYDVTWGPVAEALTAQDFFRTAHQQIYRVITTLADRGVGVDLVTVAEELKVAKMLDDIGGPSYLASLTDGVPSSINVVHYAAIVQEKARLRSVQAVATWATQQVEEQSQSAAGIADETSQRLADSVGSLAKTERVGPAAQAYVEDLDKEEAAPIATGYSDIDVMLGGGIRPGGLFLVAARPSVGKTTWALRATRHMAERGIGVAFFSLELGIKPVAGRLMSWGAKVSQAELERGTLDETAYARVTDELTTIGALPIALNESSETLGQVRGVVRKMKRELTEPLRCVVVDYLQLLAAEVRRKSITEEVAGLSRGLKRLAQTEDVAVMALSQLSRSPEGRKDKRPHLSDLRDSGALEQDADVVILLFRPEMYGVTPDNQGLAEAIIAKNRMTGKTGTVGLRFDKDLATFQDLSHHHHNQSEM